MAKEKSDTKAKLLALKEVLEKKKWELDDREWEQKSMAKELNRSATSMSPSMT